jgi:hypothetical protein
VTRLDRRAVGMLAGTVVLVAVMVPLAAGREEAFDTVLYASLPLVLASATPRWCWDWAGCWPCSRRTSLWLRLGHSR